MYQRLDGTSMECAGASGSGSFDGRRYYYYRSTLKAEPLLMQKDEGRSEKVQAGDVIGYIGTGYSTEERIE